MRKKFTFTILLSFLVILLHSQAAKIDAFRFLFENIAAYHGNVFLNNVYLKADTARLRKMYPSELAGEFEIIERFNLRLTDFNMNGLDGQLFNIRTTDEFYKEKHKRINISSSDSVQLVKIDSFHATISRQFTGDKGDSLSKLQNLLLMSTFNQKLKGRSSKAQPKHMTLVSVFESDYMWMFIYYFMALDGYLHYYVKSDIILK